MKMYRFTRDLKGASYRHALEVLIGHSAMFSIVWREELRFLPELSGVVSSLKPFHLKSERRERWPGTRLLSGVRPIVNYYTAVRDAADVLFTVESLFSWRAPEYPEDLVFYRNDYSCVFASIAHEQEAWVLDKSLAAVLGQIVTLELVEVNDESFGVITGAA